MSEAEDDTQMEKAPEVEEMSAKANEDLARLCGSEEMAERVKKLWEDLMEKKRLDVSKQRLSDTEVGMLLKGLYSMARTTGFQTERMKPLPITELDFSGNELTAKGIDEVVQFARTAGANATLVDLSDNRLNDAATNELARLVKNYKCAAIAPPPPRHRHPVHPGAQDSWIAPRLPPTNRRLCLTTRSPRPLSPAARLRLRSCWASCCSTATRSARPERPSSSSTLHITPIPSLATTPPPATYHPTHHAPACSRPRYAHWERDRYKNEAEPPPPMKLDLSDNCVDHPAQVPPNPNPNPYPSPSPSPSPNPNPSPNPSPNTDP